MATNRIVSFRDLEVWQDGMLLAESCYKLTSTYPRHELYGLVSQTRRAVVSIPSNIAEGKVRPTNAYRNHVSIALGSQAELDTVLELAGRLNLVAPDGLAPIQRHVDRVGRMLNALATSLERRAAE